MSRFLDAARASNIKTTFGFAGIFMNTIAISAATFGELAGPIEAFHADGLPDDAPWDFFVSRHDRISLVFAVTGIGAANAAAATAVLIQRFSPDLVINTGCAGAYDRAGLAVGDLALATSELFADLGAAAPNGWLSLEQMGLPLLDRAGRHCFNEVPLSRPAAEMALARAARLGVPVKPGRFLTVSACSGTRSRGAELQDRFGGICENMEGAAVALVTARYGRECLEVRGVSNLVEDRDLTRWDIPLAVANAGGFIEQLIKGFSPC